MFTRIIKSTRATNKCLKPFPSAFVHSSRRMVSSSSIRSSDIEAITEDAPQVGVSKRPEPSVRMMIPPADDPLLHYLASHIMQHGERHKASRVVTNMLAQIHRLTEAPPLPILRHAIFLASPSVRIKSHKKSAKSVMVPMPLSDRQRTFFAVQWLLNASKSRNERKLEDRLAKEVIRIIEGESDVLKKKTEVHKLAVANRSNAAVKPGR